MGQQQQPRHMRIGEELAMKPGGEFSVFRN